MEISKTSRASHFLSSSIASPTDEEAKFTFKEMRVVPVDSIETVIYESSKDTKVEEERCTYNATINRVRTPPPFYK